MKNRVSSTILVLCLFAGAAASALAADRPQRKPVNDQIEKVDAKAQTITICRGPNKSVTYKVPEKAKITIGGKPAEFKDLKPDMKAFVSHKSGSDSADSISAQPLLKGKAGGGHRH